MNISHIILIRGAVETLEYFSLEMAKAFEKAGLHVWFWDMAAPLQSRESFERLIPGKDLVFLTFNFIGLSGESQFSYGEQESIWEHFGVRSYCIMVDHPMYYHRQLSADIQNLTLICIDRDHQRFTQEYYPFYGTVLFLPLAGTELPGEKIPYHDRSIDVLFAGNYVPIENLMPHIAHMDEDSRQFYFDIIRELIEDPSVPMERKFIDRLKGEFPQITREELLSCLHSMIFIDLYIRSYFRREIICSLAENDIPVLVIGKDWEKAGCRCPENIRMTGQLDSLGCLQYMQNAKVSVNIMPWFKDGAHDRIFNAMLQGCTVVTDTSHYLDEVLREGTDFTGFTLTHREEISRKVKHLFAHPDLAGTIASNGYTAASGHHTWEERVRTLLMLFAN